MKNIFRLIKILLPNEKKKLVLLIFASIFLSFIEMIATASIVPFVSAIIEPKNITTNNILIFLNSLFKPADYLNFVIFLGILVVIAVSLGTVFKMGVFYFLYRYTGTLRASLSSRLFRQYLLQPYNFFLKVNSSELTKNILNEVDLIINDVLRPALEIIVNFLMFLMIFGILFFSNPFISIISVFIFSLFYLLIYSFIRPRMAKQGNLVREVNRLRYKTTNEAFQAIKDLKILHKESYFLTVFNKAAKKFSNTQANKQILSTLPSQIIQPLVIGFLVLIVILILSLNNSITEFLPLFTLFLYASQKMIPEIQILFRNTSQIKYYSHILDSFCNDMIKLKIPEAKIAELSQKTKEIPPQAFNKYFELKNIYFIYDSSRKFSLTDINLKVEKNTTVGLVGQTGCGKTTLVDVIMLLLNPTQGEILIDDQPLSSIEGWQRKFGYVPQHIFLADESIAANIALGVPKQDWDLNAIYQAAQMANLHNFILDELPQKYETIVGEKGIRLSGGQRQRVGIARALYHEPDIIVMDEATSALDTVTENLVMEAIKNLAQHKTIIIIAHRLSTVKLCDIIYFMEKGQIIDKGDFDYLVGNNLKFRKFVSKK